MSELAVTVARRPFQNVQGRNFLPQNVFLGIDPALSTGPLVVHAWDVPQAARVRIEDISLVW